MNPTTTPHQYSILVVDDNRAAALAIAELLGYFGHLMRIAYSGEETLRVAADEKLDVIFLDIGLPDIAGFEVAKRLRELGNKVKIIGLSGYGQESDKQQAMDAGFDHHLTKPASLNELQSALDEVMRAEEKSTTD